MIWRRYVGVLTSIYLIYIYKRNNRHLIKWLYWVEFVINPRFKKNLKPSNNIFVFHIISLMDISPSHLLQLVPNSHNVLQIGLLDFCGHCDSTSWILNYSTYGPNSEKDHTTCAERQCFCGAELVQHKSYAGKWIGGAAGWYNNLQKLLVLVNAKLSCILLGRGNKLGIHYTYVCRKLIV